MMVENLDFELILNNIDIPILIFNKNKELLFSNSKENISIKDFEFYNSKNYEIKELSNYFIVYLNKDKQINQIYTDFIATISHELRTPLTSIKGFVDTIINSSDRLTEEQKFKFLNIIKEQLVRLTKLIENLLTVTKLHNPSDSIIFKNIDIKQIVSKVITIIKTQYPKHIYQTDFSSNLPFCYTDEDKIQQVLINLIENAAKYSEEGSMIKVKATFSQKDNCNNISIIDEGIGISEENYEKIFNKFSRIDNPLTRKVQGSGLGLFITKSLVEKLSGEIIVRSLDKGTCFSVKIPVSNPLSQLNKKFKREENA